MGNGLVAGVSRGAALARWLALWAALGFLWSGGLAWGETGGRIELHVADGRLSLRAGPVPRDLVLARVAGALRARLIIDGAMPGERGYWDLREVPVAEAVTQIARPWDVLLVLGPAGAGVSEIHVFGPSPERKRSSTTEATDGPPAQAPLPAGLALADGVPDAAEQTPQQAIAGAELALTSPDPAVRLAAVHGLGRMGGDDATRLLTQVALGARRPEERMAAERALAASENELARTVLRALRARPSARPTANAPPLRFYP